MGPAIIGVSEIENYRVLEDILKQPALADRGYQYVHYEGEAVSYTHLFPKST